MGMSCNQAGGKGGIREFTPQYEFWLGIFEDEPTLQEQFRRRVENADGFIDWDFLPGHEKIARQHQSRQYRAALNYVKLKIEFLPVNRRPDSMNRPGIIEVITYLERQKRLVDKIIMKRERAIERHQTNATTCTAITNDEIELARKSTESHVEVCEQWAKIKENIEASLGAFKRELAKRDIQQRRDERQRRDEEETCCTSCCGFFSRIFRCIFG